jgi:proteasome lid subunit RPN8/RPN11
MVGSGSDGAWLTWTAPQCPFTIQYSTRALDDIRLAVTDAFFSLPRGGAEIGGILVGTFDGSRLFIQEHALLDCEHAFGPSFTISLNDEVRLRELLAHAPAKYGLQVVGWYHSHTRSAIHLSDSDLEVHKLFFPEPWQIALVMKPHTFEPARIGFFFRERDGSMRTESSYQEVILEAQPMGYVMRGAPPLSPETARAAPVSSGADWSRSSQVEVEATAEPVLEEQPLRTAAAAVPASTRALEAPPAEIQQQAIPARPELAVPQFARQEPPLRGRLWLAAVLGGVATIGAIGAAVKTREAWIPRFVSAVRPNQTAASPAPSMGLRTADFDGQLQINWDRFSPTVQEGAVGILELTDGGPLPRSIPLDLAHLQTGTFTYARQSEKVDVKLIVRRPDGQESREATTFLGRLPERKPPLEDGAARKQRDELAAQAAKLKTDLNSQAARTRKLEKDLETMREEMRRQQRKRMVNQVK